MAIPLFDKEVRVHQLLGDNPNTENNLSADEIKKKFDTPAEEIKEFINSVIVPALTGLIPDASLIFVIGEERPMFNPVLWLDVSGQDDFTIGALKYIDANGTEFPFYPITKASSIADLQDLKEEMEAQVKLMQSSAIVEAAYAKEAAIHKLTAPAGSKNLKFSPTTPYEDGDVITYNGIIMTPKTQDGEPLSGGAWAAGAVVMCFVSGNMLF